MLLFSFSAVVEVVTLALIRSSSCAVGIEKATLQLIPPVMHPAGHLTSPP